MRILGSGCSEGASEPGQEKFIFRAGGTQLRAENEELPGKLAGAKVASTPVTWKWSTQMLESSSMPAASFSADELGPLNDREHLLLALFRLISDQQQRDVLRVIAAFAERSD